MVINITGEVLHREKVVKMKRQGMDGLQWEALACAPEISAGRSLIMLL